MNLQDFINSINNYQKLSNVDQIKLERYSYKLMDYINYMNDDEEVKVCPLCDGIGCNYCNHELISIKELYLKSLVSYTDKVIAPLINKSHDIKCLFNPLIIKSSLYEEYYDILFKPLLGLEYTEYLAKIKYSNLAKEARNKYAIDNVKIIDYGNPLEANFCERYFSYLVDEKTELTVSEDLWIMKYLSYKKAYKMDTKINLNIVNLRMYIKKEKISLLKPKSLIKINNFIKVLGTETTIFRDGGTTLYIVSINPLAIYLTDFRGKKEKILPQIIKTCHHEMRHVLQTKMFEENRNPSFDVLLWARENLIYNVMTDYYKNNYSAMAIEMDAKIYEIEQTLKTLKKYSPTLYKLKSEELKDELEYEKALKNTRVHYDGEKRRHLEESTKNMVDRIILEVPECLNEYCALQREYNIDGTRKNLLELLNDEHKFNDEIKNFQKELYTEKLDDEEFKLVQKILNKAINDGLKLYDELIYLSVANKPDKYIIDMCNKLYINDIKRVRSAVDAKIVDSITKNNQALENKYNGYISNTDWLICDKYFSKQYSEGYYKKELLSKLIQKRDEMLPNKSQKR